MAPRKINKGVGEQKKKSLGVTMKLQPMNGTDVVETYDTSRPGRADETTENEFMGPTVVKLGPAMG